MISPYGACMSAIKMIDFLGYPDTQDLLNRLKNETDPLILRKRLSKDYSPEESIALIEQVLLRQRAQKKFTHPEKMLFDREGLEQASHELVARYHAHCFTADDSVLEVGTGIGSDLIELSKHVSRVYTIDTSCERTELARYNLTACGNPEVVTFLTNELRSIDLPDGITAIFADPSRRIDAKRTVDPAECSPSLDDVRNCFARLHSDSSRLVMKLSPLCDFQALLDDGNITVISFGGEVREVLFTLGSEVSGIVKAVVLTEDGSDYILSSEAAVSCSVSSMKKYIIEPDPAIIRADLVTEFAQTIGASSLTRRLAYITSDQKPSTCVQATFKVIEVFPFSTKRIKKYLKDKKIKELSVKKRGVASTARQIQRDISISTGSNVLYLFVYRIGSRYEACLTERCG